jgi:hypothetical protein
MEQDIEVIERCLRMHIEVRFRNTSITFMRFVKTKLGKNDDVIKNGLYTFNKMYNELKLKTTEQVWFIYLSNGNIKQEYKNVCAILLNKVPSVKSCFYSINKTPLKINNDMDRVEKMHQIKNFNACLAELFNTERVIKYENFN